MPILGGLLALFAHLRLLRCIRKDLLHDLSVKEMRVDPVTKVMEKSRQNNTLMLVFGEWQSRLLRKATNMELFVIRRQSLHLLIAEICSPQTMLESIMNGSWEHHIVRPKLVDVF